MTFTPLIAINLGLSIIALLVVFGCVRLAHRLPGESQLDSDWRDWGHPLPVALVTESTSYPAAA